MKKMSAAKTQRSASGVAQSGVAQSGVAQHRAPPRFGERGFTGRHMALLLVLFFGVVIAVNVIAVWVAVSSFGGTIVENSYVASQNYNRWLASAAAQKKLGWQESIRVDEARHIVALITKDERILANIAVTGQAELVPGSMQGRAPGKTPDRVIIFAANESGEMRSQQPLPRGRWVVTLTVSHPTGIAKYRRDLPQDLQ